MIRRRYNRYRRNPKVPVYLTAFGKGEVRYVDVPDDIVGDDLLEGAFRFGQNDIQKQPAVSVSVGDVIRLPDGTLHRVMMSGFKRLPDGYNPLTLLDKDAIFEGYGFNKPRGRLRRYRRY